MKKRANRIAVSAEVRFRMGLPMSVALWAVHYPIKTEYFSVASALHSSTTRASEKLPY